MNLTTLFFCWESDKWRRFHMDCCKRAQATSWRWMKDVRLKLFLISAVLILLSNFETCVGKKKGVNYTNWVYNEDTIKWESVYRNLLFFKKKISKMLLKSEFLIKQTSMEYVVGRIIGDKEVHQMLPRFYTTEASEGLWPIWVTFLCYCFV